MIEKHQEDIKMIIRRYSAFYFLIILALIFAFLIFKQFYFLYPAFLFFILLISFLIKMRKYQKYLLTLNIDNLAQITIRGSKMLFVTIGQVKTFSSTVLCEQNQEIVVNIRYRSKILKDIELLVEKESNSIYMSNARLMFNDEVVESNIE